VSAAPAAAAQRAAAFLAGCPEAVLRRALAALRGGAGVASLLALLERQQRADGSFPAAPPRSALAETRRALALLDDVGVREGALHVRACAFLGAAQQPDGHWGAGAEEAVVETGLLTGLLARSPCAPTAMLERAADWLAAQFSPERVKGGAPALAAWAAAFANRPHDAADGILQWCGRELERDWRSGRCDAPRAARVLLACDAPALPGGRLAAAELVAALVAQQEQDGGWPGPEAERGERAWDGLVALLRFGGASL
jgi:hypothetical protein